MSEQPQSNANVTVNAPDPPRQPGWDPTQGPFWVRTLINTTFAGAVLLMFTMNYMKQGEQAEKITDKIQAGLDKQEDRRAKEQEREIARSDKIHETNETRLREWNKAIADRQQLEADKVRLELKGMTEQLKLMTDRLHMAMKD